MRPADKTSNADKTTLGESLIFIKNKHCEVLVSCSGRKVDNFCMEGIARKFSNHATACEILVISKNCKHASKLMALHAG